MEEQQEQQQQQEQPAALVRPHLLRVKSPPPGLWKVHLVGASGSLASNVGLCAWLWEGSLYGWAAGALGYSTASFQLMLGDVHLQDRHCRVDNDGRFRTVADLGITDGCCITVLREETWTIFVGSYFTNESE